MHTIPQRSFATLTPLRFLIFLAAPSAIAATVNTGTLVTSFSAPPSAPAPAVNESTTATVDLSNLTGLTPGHDIIITFTTADSLIWVGGFNADEDDLTLYLSGSFHSHGRRLHRPFHRNLVLRPPAMARRRAAPATTPSPPHQLPSPSPSPGAPILSSVDLTLTDLSSVTGLNAMLDSLLDEPGQRHPHHHLLPGPRACGHLPRPPLRLPASAAQAHPI